MHASLAALIFRVLSASRMGWAKFLAGAIITKFVIGLGLGLAVFTGMEVLTAYIFSQIRAYLSGLPADIVTILNMAGVPEALGIVAGAWTLRGAYAGGRVFFGRFTNPI